MTQLFANRTWFEFRILNRDSTGRAEALSVYQFSGKEIVSVPYEFCVELVSKNSNLDLTDFLGAEALLTFADRSGERRKLRGVIRQMEQLHTANLFTHYRAVVVPRLWFLGQTQDHRIYQHQSVVQIIETVLKKHTFLPESYSFKLRSSYPEREYCVQYGESDLHFLSRICEEEGIFFYFEHNDDGHCLCFADAPGGQAISGESTVRFYAGSGHPADTAVVSRLNLQHRVNSDSSSYEEWNFTAPGLGLSVKDRETEWEKAPVPQSMELETYQFPHLYDKPDEGNRYVRIQMQRQLTFRQWIDCESDVSRFLPGFTFTLHSHPRNDVNRNWWIVSVHHKGEQPDVLEHESPDDRGLTYISTIKAIPDDIRFVPDTVHKKVRIEGLQSAIVTGPGGEEVYTDEYGRVKVQFHWDRLGQDDENTTCWVRVADSWAGINFGFVQIPRIGQEVMVEFMEGDPDRPVITGRTYNAALMPPWQLPEQKTLSGIQSREFNGGQRNQIIFDDTKGQVQAQLSSDHELSQLNIGYITRINHVEGRESFRGEGFELRTDAWGAIRAGKGLFISTDARSKAGNHHKDINELDINLKKSALRHEDQLTIGYEHKAYIQEDVDQISQALKKQSEEVHGTGKPHEELSSPHILLSSPAGIAVGTPESIHMQTGHHMAITSDKHIALASGNSFLAMVMDKINIFAYKKGIKLFSGKSKIEVQAQSSDIEIVADQVLKLISAKKKIELFAAEEVVIVGGTSYIKINGSGIEQGTKGHWKAKAASHKFLGPASLDPFLPTLPSMADCMQDAQKCARPACPLCMAGTASS